MHTASKQTVRQNERFLCVLIFFCSLFVEVHPHLHPYPPSQCHSYLGVNGDPCSHHPVLFVDVCPKFVESLQRLWVARLSGNGNTQVGWYFLRLRFMVHEQRGHTLVRPGASFCTSGNQNPHSRHVDDFLHTTDEHALSYRDLQPILVHRSLQPRRLLTDPDATLQKRRLGPLV